MEEDPLVEEDISTAYQVAVRRARALRAPVPLSQMRRAASLVKITSFFYEYWSKIFFVFLIFKKKSVQKNHKGEKRPRI